MNTEKIKKILGLFQKYHAVIVKVNDDVEHGCLVFFSEIPNAVLGESDNEVLWLYCEPDGKYTVTFNESGLNGAIINADGNLEMFDNINDDAHEFKFQETKSINLVNEIF